MFSSKTFAGLASSLSMSTTRLIVVGVPPRLSKPIAYLEHVGLRAFRDSLDSFMPVVLESQVVQMIYQFSASLRTLPSKALLLKA